MFAGPAAATFRSWAPPPGVDPPTPRNRLRVTREYYTSNE